MLEIEDSDIQVIKIQDRVFSLTNAKVELTRASTNAQVMFDLRAKFSGLGNLELATNFQITPFTGLEAIVTFSQSIHKRKRYADRPRSESIFFFF